MSLAAIVRNYISKIRPGADAELQWFIQQPSLTHAIEYAALAINSRGKRYSHQSRIKKEALSQARDVLLSSEKLIQQCKSFDELITLIDAALQPIPGIGELYVYDTALRVGARLALFPKKVYIHAGTREGAKALGFSGKERAIEVSSFPAEFSQLEPCEIEDVLCIFKNLLKRERWKGVITD